MHPGHTTPKVKEKMNQLESDRGIIPQCTTKFLQPCDVSINNYWRQLSKTILSMRCRLGKQKINDASGINSQKDKNVKIRRIFKSISCFAKEPIYLHFEYCPFNVNIYKLKSHLLICVWWIVSVHVPVFFRWKNFSWLVKLEI